MKAQTILDTIGNTPHVRINRLFDPGVEVWVKLERANPGASIKDRIGIAMIDDAERRGILKPGSVIVEPTSGNTGIGLAMAAAVKGYALVLVMPESMSIERRRIMAAYGAVVELTPTEWSLLTVLASSPGRVFSRSELVNRVRGYEFDGYERTVDSHIKNLRRKVEPDPHDPTVVETVLGAGYRLGLSRDRA